MKLIVIFASILCSFGVHSSPTGAPVAACTDMVPQHGYPAQTSVAPFLTIPEKVNIRQGESLKLTLQSWFDDKLFRGYLLMAFDPSGGIKGPMGTFSSPSNGRVFSCSNDNNNNAVTHSNNLDKMNVTVMWTPPQGYIGSVEFITTYVQNVNTFWVRTYANFIVNVLNDSPTNAPPGGSFDCSFRDDGNYPDPYTCAYYWTCANRYAFRMECPYNMEYYAAKDYCDYKGTVPGC